METGKLILIGVCAFLLLSLWSNESTSALTEAVTTETAAEAPTYDEEAISAPSARPLSFPANVSLATLEPEAPVRYRYQDEEEYHVLYEDSREIDRNADEHFDTFEPRISREADYVRSEHRETGSTYSLTFTARDSDGERLRGSGNTRGQSGSGYLRGSDGRHYWLELEWENRRDLIGIAEDGSVFELNYELLDR